MTVIQRCRHRGSGGTGAHSDVNLWAAIEASVVRVVENSHFLPGLGVTGLCEQHMPHLAPENLQRLGLQQDRTHDLRL